MINNLGRSRIGPILDFNTGNPSHFGFIDESNREIAGITDVYTYDRYRNISDHHYHKDNDDTWVDTLTHEKSDSHTVARRISNMNYDESHDILLETLNGNQYRLVDIPA